MDELEDFMYELEFRAQNDGVTLKELAEELLNTPSKFRTLYVAEEREFSADDLRRKLEEIVFD